MIESCTNQIHQRSIIYRFRWITLTKHKRTITLKTIQNTCFGFSDIHYLLYRRTLYITWLSISSTPVTPCFLWFKNSWKLRERTYTETAGPTKNNITYWMKNIIMINLKRITLNKLWVLTLVTQKLWKQHLLVSASSSITYLHSGHYSSGGNSPTECVVEGNPSISLSKASLNTLKTK